jgi:predicted ArsR family transcriptional regulator
MGRAHFLGVITERLRVALVMLAERGSAEVEDVADHLAVPTSAAREVLDELLERHLALTNATGSQVISIA